VLPPLLVRYPQCSCLLLAGTFHALLSTAMTALLPEYEAFGLSRRQPVPCHPIPHDAALLNPPPPPARQPSHTYDAPEPPYYQKRWAYTRCIPVPVQCFDVTLFARLGRDCLPHQWDTAALWALYPYGQSCRHISNMHLFKDSMSDCALWMASLPTTNDALPTPCICPPNTHTHTHTHTHTSEQFRLGAK